MVASKEDYRYARGTDSSLDILPLETTDTNFCVDRDSRSGARASSSLDIKDEIRLWVIP